MKNKICLASAIVLACGALSAQNKANVTLMSGDVESFSTSELRSIDINENGTVVVNPLSGNPTTYDRNVAKLSFVKNKAGHVVLKEAGGWFETSYVKWENMDEASAYDVYVKAVDGDYQQLDNELVRNYGSYGRADIMGLKAGSYVMKVVPVVNGAPVEEMASETTALEVRAHDRGGFAHFNYAEGVGAYNNDGTLKAGAKVLYITKETAKTVTTEVITNASKGTKETRTGLQNIIQGYEKGADHTPMAIRIIGRLTAADMDALGSSSEGLQIKGKNASVMNMTIEGVGDDATIHGFGILIRAAAGVEIRNIGVLWCLDDGMSMDTNNEHIWIHNCDFFYGRNKGGDQAKGDGSLDSKTNSKYCTYSYNHFWDCGKTSLCGMKSESGPNYKTYHHNWFDHSDSRHPRIRTMSIHIYNNYFDGISKYGVGAAYQSNAFVENNYFRNTRHPILSSKQGSDILDGDGKGTFSGEDGGVVKSYGNIMCGKYYYRPWSETNTVEFDAWEAPSRDAKVPASVVAKQGGRKYDNFDTDPSLMYSYTPDAAADVPAIVKGVYGAGRINHGDFHWTFNNNTQDHNYDIIPELSTTIQNYDSWLVGFYGHDLPNGGKGFTNPGGDATEGAEFPDGNGNAANGSVSGGDTPDVPVEAGEILIGNADGSYLTMGAENSELLNALMADGTITLDATSSLKPDFTNATYDFGSTGSIQLGKSGGYMIVKCKSLAVFKVKMLRTGSYKTSVQVSTDGGATYKEVATDTSKKGVVEKDWSSVVKSDSEVYVKIVNNSTGGLNIVGLTVCLAK